MIRSEITVGQVSQEITVSVFTTFDNYIQKCVSTRYLANTIENSLLLTVMQRLHYGIFLS